MTTVAEFHALIAEHAAAEERHMRAFRAVLPARPTTPATMGRQLR